MLGGAAGSKPEPVSAVTQSSRRSTGTGTRLALGAADSSASTWCLKASTPARSTSKNTQSDGQSSRNARVSSPAPQQHHLADTGEHRPYDEVVEDPGAQPEVAGEPAPQRVVVPVRDLLDAHRPPGTAGAARTKCSA